MITKTYDIMIIFAFFAVIALPLICLKTGQGKLLSSESRYTNIVSENVRNNVGAAGFMTCSIKNTIFRNDKPIDSLQKYNKSAIYIYIYNFPNFYEELIHSLQQKSNIFSRIRTEFDAESASKVLCICIFAPILAFAASHANNPLSYCFSIKGGKI